MTSRVIPVKPFDLVILGATGDLAHRKILPALFQRDRDGQIPKNARIIGAARSDRTNEAYRQEARRTLEHGTADEPPTADMLERFLRRIQYVSMDAAGDHGWDALREVLEGRENVVRAFYFAVAPDLFATIVSRVGSRGLIHEKTRAVLEKPIGRDLNSAIAVNRAAGQVFRENQVFRIDHYLGKETVQNLMALRFANTLFEPLWNSTWIDHVQITVAESDGVKGRGAYYDHAGALRDMVQNHLLQLLCLIAIEPPDTMNADGIRDEKLKVLRALRPLAGEEANTKAVRGQYRPGADSEGPVPGYLDDIASEESDTETFVALRVEVQNWRWAGVPFYLRTGKRLRQRVSEIVVAFRPIPHSIFGENAGRIAANRLVLRLQPNEGVRLEIMIKDPGLGGMRLRHVPLDMTFAESFGAHNPDAYERLIMDVVRGDQTLFMRRDEVEAAWKWIDPIRAAWNSADETPRPYTAGSWGPTTAIALIERDGRTWLEDEDA